MGELENVKLARVTPSAPRADVAAAELRCPYCHARIGLLEPTWRCPECATRHHRECAHEHGRCTLLGCLARRRPLPRGVPVERGPIARAIAILRAAGYALAVLVFALLSWIALAAVFVPRAL